MTKPTLSCPHCRKKLNLMARIMIAMAAMGLVATVATSLWMGSQGRMVQRVRLNDPSIQELTGEKSEPIGSAELAVVFDQKAIVETSGGVVQVDDAYLQSTRQRPIQVKTVRFLATLAAIAFTGVGLMGLALQALVAGAARKRTDLACTLR